MSDTLEFRVLIDPHEDIVDAFAVASAIARAIEYAMDNDIGATDALCRQDLGQVSVSFVPEQDQPLPAQSNCQGLVAEMERELTNMGLDSDQDVNGGDAVEYLGKLINDAREAMMRDGMVPLQRRPDCPTNSIGYPMYQVICLEHGHQPLTEDEYLAALDEPDTFWKCPICSDGAEWDDDSGCCQEAEDWRWPTTEENPTNEIPF